jgi:hypothetical protein
MSQPAGGGSRLGRYLGVVWRLVEDDKFYEECNRKPKVLLDALNATARVHGEKEFDPDAYAGVTKIAPQADYKRLLDDGDCDDFGQPITPMCLAGMFSPTPPGCLPPPPPR